MHSKFVAQVSNAEIKKRGEKFLERKDLCRIIRREILFGLIPKTLKRKLEYPSRTILYSFSAGDDQVHILRNAFNILGNEGFLREQGVLSLESVQEFYKIIKEEPVPASLSVMNLLDFCDKPGFNEPDYLPVIAICETGETLGHAVVLSDYDRYEDELILSTIDSAAENGQTFIRCPIDGEIDQRCLELDKCYFIRFN